MTTHTATLRDLTIGDGTSYKFEREPEGLAPGRYRTSRLVGRSTDGAYVSGSDRLETREVVLSVEVFLGGSGYSEANAAAVDALLKPLLAAWAPVRDGVIALWLNVSGDDLVLFGRPTETTVDAEGIYYGFARVRLTFEATDPRLYSAVEKSVTLGLTVGGGLMFPVTFPASFGAGSDSDASVVNAGGFETEWTAVIIGPVDTPRLTLGETGEFLELAGDVPAGQRLVVDSSDESVTLSGSPRPTWPTFPSSFWALPAGTSTVRFRAASGSGSCTFAWRDADL